MAWDDKDEKILRKLDSIETSLKIALNNLPKDRARHRYVVFTLRDKFEVIADELRRSDYDPNNAEFYLEGKFVAAINNMSAVEVFAIKGVK